MKKITEKEKFDQIRDLILKLEPSEKTSLAVAVAIIKTVGLDKALRAIKQGRPGMQAEAEMIAQAVKNRN